ncbi:MAG: hypothetical protein QNK37_35560 [Acidobacteriota bacterium]|nr:hypothetical protein [Acidobacteriota bacterium]
MLDLFDTKQVEPASCIIKVGQSAEEIVDLYPFLIQLDVKCRREEASVATLKFETRRDENGAWTIQDADVFKPWEPIIIEASFGSYSEEIMRGYIREVNADYPSDAGNTTVQVECQDDSLVLDREHRRENWGADAPTTDTVILAELLGNVGLTPNPDNAEGRTGLVLNQDSTDIRFIRDRAEANGYELIFRDGNAYFGPMRLDSEPQATIMVYAGRDTNCMRINVKSDGHQADSVSIDTASPDSAATVSQTVQPDQPLLGNEAADSTSAGLGDFNWRLTRQGVADEEELTARAQKKANELAMKVKAEGELDGSIYGHVLRVGEPVGVDGIGEWMGGIYYVDKVDHVMDSNGYRQTFTLMRNAYGDNLESGGGLLDAIL